ncbi:unnamed protein product, partial [Timema podura]|nr:unnamed protein product [Timema podura]
MAKSPNWKCLVPQPTSLPVTFVKDHREVPAKSSMVLATDRSDDNILVINVHQSASKTVKQNNALNVDQSESIDVGVSGQGALSSKCDVALKDDKASCSDSGLLSLKMGEFQSLALIPESTKKKGKILQTDCRTNPSAESTTDEHIGEDGELEKGILAVSYRIVMAALGEIELIMVDHVVFTSDRARFEPRSSHHRQSSILRGQLVLGHMASEEMPADVLTKALTKSKHGHCVELLGLIRAPDELSIVIPRGSQRFTRTDSRRRRILNNILSSSDEDELVDIDTQDCTMLQSQRKPKNKISVSPSKDHKASQSLQKGKRQPFFGKGDGGWKRSRTKIDEFSSKKSQSTRVEKLPKADVRLQTDVSHQANMTVGNHGRLSLSHRPSLLVGMFGLSNASSAGRKLDKSHEKKTVAYKLNKTYITPQRKSTKRGRSNFQKDIDCLSEDDAKSEK